VRTVAPGAILATNTSSLSVEAIGADVGLHFFNPVALLPLVEIVRTAHTTDEQLASAWEVVQKLRKRGVIVLDAPGFVVNRLLTRMTCVLADALANGNSVEECDEAILSLGLPMAPSVLLQLVGPAVARHVLETMHDAWPDRFPLEPPSGGARRTQDEIRDEAVAAIADEVQHLLDDGVVADPADVDACLILGAGWPLFLGGLVTRNVQAVGL
jgi:3-hydroxyacyl-CoA dehydrogenase